MVSHSQTACIHTLAIPYFFFSDCQRVALSGLPSFSPHIYLTGVYNIQPGFLQQNRPVFKHQFEDKLLFYRGNRWQVGATVKGGGAVVLRAASRVTSPELVQSTWQVRDGNGWKNEPAVSVTCQGKLVHCHFPCLLVSLSARSQHERRLSSHVELTPLIRDVALYSYAQ